MQVVDSVLIFRSSSIALQEISGVKIPTREGHDVNQQERKLSFLSAVFLFVLMSAVIAVFALTERADFSTSKVLGIFFTVVILAIAPLWLYSKKLFPVKIQKEYGLEVLHGGTRSTVFWHKNKYFVKEVADALNEAANIEGSEAFNWFVDFKRQGVKLCRRFSIRDAIRLLIERAKERVLASA